MDLSYLIFLVLIILFGIISIKSDFKQRKVRNEVTILFFLISFVLYILNLDKLVWFDFILLFIIIFGVFYLYKKGVWGAADGKIFLSITLLLLSYGQSASVLNFAVNLLLFYLISLFVLVVLRTSFKQKFKIISQFNYREEIFILLFVFLFIRILFVLLPFELKDLYVMLFVFAFILMIANQVRKQLRKHLKEIHSDEMLFLSFIMFATLSFVGVGLSFIYTFFIILLLKISINIVSTLSENAGKTKEKYYSPFTLYLFAAALFTLITNKSIILIIVSLFL